MPGVSRATARNERGQWLLDLDFGGRTFRFPTLAADVPRTKGDEGRYDAGLADFSLGSSLGATASVGLTIDTGIPLQQERMNWALMVAQGIDLEERPGILRRWFPGQTLEEARVWLIGTTINANYADPDAHPGRLTISLERRPLAGRTIPGPQERVDNETFPSRGGVLVIDETIIGAAYPLIIGAPGTREGQSFGDPVVPALMAELSVLGTDDRLVISREEIQAKAVQLYDIDAPANEIRTVDTMLDKLGQKVSFIDFVGATLVAASGTKYYVGMLADGGDTYGGGALDPRTGRLVRGGADVISFLLQLNGTAVDFGRMAALEPELNGYLFDAFINTPIVAFEWLQKNILPLLPVIERQGEFGLYYDVERWEARATDVTVRLDADSGAVHRIAPIVKRQQGEIYNEFTIEFAPRLATTRYTQRLILTAQDLVLSELNQTLSDTRVVGDLRCALSQRKFEKVKPAPPIQTSAVWEPATALKILRDRASRDALPKRVTVYQGGAELEYVVEGAIALVIDTKRGAHLPGNIARVDNVQVGDGTTVLSVTLLDDPLEVKRALG